MNDTTSKAVGRKKNTQRKGRLTLAAPVIATKRISVAVAGSSLLAILLLRLCPVFHPALIPLRLVPAFSLLLFLPGFILLNWLLPETVQSFVETVPLAFGVSLAFWAPVFLVMLMLTVSPAILLLVALLALLALFVAYLFLASDVDEREIRLAPSGREFWFVWGGMALSFALMIYTGGSLRGDEVTFHLPMVRRVVDGTRLSRGYVVGTPIVSSRSYIFPLWHIVEALISMLGGVEPAHVWYYGPSFLVPISVLAIYLLAKALLKDDRIACLSTPVYLVAAAYFDRFTGVTFGCWLAASNRPEGLNQWVLLPVVLTFLVYYLQCQLSRVWVWGGAVYVLGFAMGVIHVSQLFFALAWLVVFLTAYPILIGWNRQALMRAAGIVLIFALFFVALFWFADTWLAPDQDLSYLGMIQSDNEVFFHLGWESGIHRDEHDTKYDYESQMYIFPPYLVVGAAALFPLFLVIGRKMLPLAVVFMFTGLITPPLLRLEPHILSVTMQVIPTLPRMNYQVQFPASVLIVTATIGALLPLLDRWIVYPCVLMVRRMSVWARWVGFLGICGTSALLIWLITHWRFLKDWVLLKQLRLSSTPFFAYLAFVALLAVSDRFRGAKGNSMGLVSRVWKVELRQPLLTVIVVAACLAFLAIPGLFWLQPLKGQPLLPSDMNTEAGAARFEGAIEWDPELIHFLRDHTAEDAVIYSGSGRYRYLIPVYVNRRTRQVNWADFKGIGELRQRDPTYVLFLRLYTPPTDMNDLIYLSSAFRTDGELFERVYESAPATLFRISPASQGIAELQLNHVLAGNAYFVEEEWNKAIAEYEAALTLDSGDALAHLGLAQVYQAQGELEQAIAEYRKVIAASPDEVWPRVYLAQAYAAQGEVEEVIVQYRQIFELAADEAEGYAYLSDAYKADGWMEEAIGVYKDVVSDSRPVCPQDRWLEEAIVVYKAAVAINPDRAWLHLELGQLYQEGGRVEEAIAEYQKAIELEPTSAEAYIQLGDLYKAQVRMEEAIALYQAAARRNPRAAWPHIEVGKVYLEEAGRDETD